MVGSSTFIGRRTVLANMLDTPVSELAVREYIYLCQYLLNCRSLLIVSSFLVSVRQWNGGFKGSTNYLLFLHTVLENVLHHQTPCFAQCNLVPHSTKSLIHFGHDLRWVTTPAELEELLPNMASVAVDYRLGNPAEKFVDHQCFVFLWHAVEGFLDNMATKWIHAQGESVAPDGVGNGHDLLGGAMFKAALDEEITEPIYHERIRLASNRLDYIVFLFSCADFELLLEENGCLLVITADDLVNDVFPITRDVLVEETPVV